MTARAGFVKRQVARRRVKVGRRLNNAVEWEAVAGAAANMARTWGADVVVCVDGNGRIVLVAGSEPGAHLREVARVTATAGPRVRLESSYRLRRDGWALYQAAAGLGRVLGPVATDGPAYTAEQRAALAAWVLGEEVTPSTAPTANSTPSSGVNSNRREEQEP